MPSTRDMATPRAESDALAPEDGRGGGARIAAVTDPSHYKRLDPEPIDVIERWGLDFCLGNALKYLSRAGHKPGAAAAEDLAKAIWYLSRAAKGIDTAIDLDQIAAEVERWRLVARRQRARIDDLEKRLIQAGLAELRDAIPEIAVEAYFDMSDLDDPQGGEG